MNDPNPPGKDFSALAYSWLFPVACTGQLMISVLIFNFFQHKTSEERLSLHRTLFSLTFNVNDFPLRYESEQHGYGNHEFTSI